jgi:hypothetical protein
VTVLSGLDPSERVVIRAELPANVDVIVAYSAKLDILVTIMPAEEVTERGAEAFEVAANLRARHFPERPIRSS